MSKGPAHWVILGLQSFPSGFIGHNQQIPNSSHDDIQKLIWQGNSSPLDLGFARAFGAATRMVNLAPGAVQALPKVLVLWTAEVQRKNDTTLHDR